MSAKQLNQIFKSLNRHFEQFSPFNNIDGEDHNVLRNIIKQHGLTRIVVSHGTLEIVKYFEDSFPTFDKKVYKNCLIEHTDVWEYVQKN